MPRRHGLDASYGGWLEERRALWHGSYLDAGERYLHLGTDFNVPADTPVALPWPATVLRVDDDHPEPYGWGPRVIVRPEHDANVVAVFAHLAPGISHYGNERLPAGAIVGRVGAPPRNGGWFPHLHLQLVVYDHFQLLLANGLRDLDGYGNLNDAERLARLFPNPLNILVDA
jgi:murein DD-endopeptidase MepM/ murein hydrolase activator NlpD